MEQECGRVVRESRVICGHVESRHVTDIRDVCYVSIRFRDTYIQTGAVSRTSVNCAPLCSARHSLRTRTWHGRSRIQLHATFYQGEMSTCPYPRSPLPA